MSSIILLPTLLILRDIWVHVCYLNSYNKLTDVEVSVDETSNIWAILRIPDIEPYDGHVWLGKYFDNPRLGGKQNIVEDMVVLENIFDHICLDRHVYVVYEVW